MAAPQESPPSESVSKLTAEDGDEERRATARQAGRGGLALTAGKLYFLVSGLAQQILLSRILGEGGYGALSTAQSVASISYNPIVQAGIQGVSREIATVPADEARSVQAVLMQIHVGIAVLSSVLFFILAAPLASLLGAPHITGGIRILSGVLLLYGLYAPIIGVLNGVRRFVAQAGLDILASTLRTLGLVAGAYAATRWFTSSTDPDPAIQVQSTAWGFCAAGVLILAVAVGLAGFGKKGTTGPTLGRYMAVVLPILGGQILLNLLFQADALLLRKFTADAAVLSGLAPKEADPFVGAYRQTQLFCFLPFQLLTSLTFVLFPLLATARAQERQGEVAALIERGLRIALIVAGLIIATVVAIPAGLLALVFGPESARLGADSMRILAVGMGFFAVLGVMMSAMNSLGAERQSLILIGLAALLVLILCVFGARTERLETALLSRVALATSTAMFLVTLVSALVLKKLTRANLPWLTLIRVGLGVLVTGFLGSRFLQGGHLVTLAGAIATSVLFLLVLVVSGELTKDDWHKLRALLGR